ncbi:hypothetical protein Tco_1472746 [Tanacetum coccineum]
MNASKGCCCYKLDQQTIKTTTTAISQTITTIITTLIIPTTLSFQSPFITSPIKTTPQTEGELSKDKGKKAMYHKDVAEEESHSESDAESRPSGTLEESSTTKPPKKFTYIIEKVDVFRSERKSGKKFLIRTLGQDVVEKVYKNKVKYDKYCLRMLNSMAQGKIINCNVLTRGKGPINLKVYRDDGSNEINYNFKISDLHVVEWKIVLDACPKRTGAERELDLSRPLKEQDLIFKLNQLAKRKRRNANDLHDYFKSTKRQDFISIEDFRELNNDMMSHVQEIFFKHHQGPGMDDLAKTGMRGKH